MPVIKTTRKLHGLKPRKRMKPTEMWLGISTDEIERMKDSELYIMSHPKVDGHKIGLAVDAKSRARGVGKNMNICMVTKRIHRDTMEAIEHLAQAYALVKYGQQAKLPKEIVSGRSEFFKCSEKQAKAFIACAFRQAKKLGMNALEIATYALDYILKHLGKVPHNMARWVKHVRDAQARLA